MVELELLVARPRQCVEIHLELAVARVAHLAVPADRRDRGSRSSGIPWHSSSKRVLALVDDGIVRRRTLLSTCSRKMVTCGPPTTMATSGCASLRRAQDVVERAVLHREQTSCPRGRA